MLKEIIQQTEVKMEKSTEFFEHEVTSMRAGRAHPAMLEKVPVDYYGSITPLQHLATISIPEPRLLVVQPFDKSILGAIEKALQKTDLGVSVRVEGTLLRVAVPPLSEERRRDLVKQLRRRAEDEKVAVRNMRREALEALKTAQRDHSITEDDERRGQTEIQKLTDRFIKTIDGISEAREKDILTP